MSVVSKPQLKTATAETFCAKDETKVILISTYFLKREKKRKAKKKKKQKNKKNKTKPEKPKCQEKKKVQLLSLGDLK